jgi:hygromycin-B 7''-O-kinase
VYGERFTDAAYWRPYVEVVCARHNLASCDEIVPGLPGTNPVFLIDGQYAVKFFTHFFNGAEAHPIELELYKLFASNPVIPAPVLIAQGALFDDEEGWPWPYIISRVVPGTSLGEVRDAVSYEDKETLAEFLGPVLCRLHGVSLQSARHLMPTWDAFVRFLTQQRAACVENHRGWQIMPKRLIAQIETYLPVVETLVDQSQPPHLLHCDLNEDHLLGRFDAGHWRPTGVIDFGDAKVGDRVYELIALHIGLFHCDKHLLRGFLRSYGWEEAWAQGFAFRAMCYTLLFEFNVLGQVLEEFPQAREVESLKALADWLWNPAHPGLAERAGSVS